MSLEKRSIISTCSLLPVDEDMSHGLENHRMIIPKEELPFLTGIPSSHIEKIAPLTSTQRDLYLDYLINPDPTSFSVGMTVHLGNELDKDLWCQAIALVSKNDDMLRTRFFSYQGEEYQFVDAYLPAHFECADLQQTQASQAEDIAQFILKKNQGAIQPPCSGTSLSELFITRLCWFLYRHHG